MSKPQTKLVQRIYTIERLAIYNTTIRQPDLYIQIYMHQKPFVHIKRI